MYFHDSLKRKLDAFLADIEQRKRGKYGPSDMTSLVKVLTDYEIDNFHTSCISDALAWAQARQRSKSWG